MRPLLVAMLVGGVLVGLAWRFGAPAWVSASDDAETQVGGDGVFAVLGVLAGVATAGWLARRPGRRPAVRLGVLLGAATAASVVAWLVGVLAGAVTLHAWGVLLMWPLVTALLTLLRSVVLLALHGE